jgi:membrane associated rhomboid family serine protease
MTRSPVRRALIIVLSLLAVLWVIQLVNVGMGYGLDPEFGIRSHVLLSLPDIFSAPLLHMSWAHIEGNSLPFLILGFMAALRGIRKFIYASLIIVVTAGLAVWLFAPVGAFTVGASGLIAGWLGYVILRGFIDHRLADILMGVLAGFLYLGAFDFLPNSAGISWQDHLGGLIGGLLAAFLLPRLAKVHTTRRELT